MHAGIGKTVKKIYAAEPLGTRVPYISFVFSLYLIWIRGVFPFRKRCLGAIISTNDQIRPLGESAGVSRPPLSRRTASAKALGVGPGQRRGPLEVLCSVKAAGKRESDARQDN